MSGAEEPFFDTNIIFYLLANDAKKANRAEALLAKGGVVSVQVLNEFAAAASRKLRLSWPEIREVLHAVQTVCRIEPVTLVTHQDGLDLAECFGFSLYDAMIVAAAREAGCILLYSEDLQHGQKVGDLTIRNPFRD